MKKFLGFVLPVGFSVANATGWSDFKSVCYSTLNTNHYDNMILEMKQCNQVASTLNLMQTDTLIIKSSCAEAREGSGAKDCWGAKLTAKILVLEL